MDGRVRPVVGREQRQGLLRSLAVGEVAERLAVAELLAALLAVRDRRVVGLELDARARCARRGRDERRDLGDLLPGELTAEDGMPFPPVRTWCSTVDSSGLSSSRFGPTWPFASAAFSVWQEPHPALAKTLPPGLAEPPPEPPQPATNGARASAMTAVARNFMARCLGTIAPWP